MDHNKLVKVAGKLRTIHHEVNQLASQRDQFALHVQDRLAEVVVNKTDYSLVRLNNAINVFIGKHKTKQIEVVQVN